jgi:hypothetical protein
VRALRNRIKLGARLAGNLFIADTANNRTRKKLARAIIEGCGELKIGRSALMAAVLGAGILVAEPQP